MLQAPVYFGGTLTCLCSESVDPWQVQDLVSPDSSTKTDKTSDVAAAGAGFGNRDEGKGKRKVSNCFAPEFDREDVNRASEASRAPAAIGSPGKRLKPAQPTPDPGQAGSAATAAVAEEREQEATFTCSGPGFPVNLVIPAWAWISTWLCTDKMA